MVQLVSTRGSQCVQGKRLLVHPEAERLHSYGGILCGVSGVSSL